MSMYPTMEKELARKAKYGMEPLPDDPRVEVMYPGMGQTAEVMESVDRMRDANWEALNDKIRNNEPASLEEVAALLESKPWINGDNPDILQMEIKRNRQANLMYCRTGTLTFDEIQKAKEFNISDGITPENRKRLEKAADAWREEKGSWAGWEERRLEMIQEIVAGQGK